MRQTGELQFDVLAIGDFRFPGGTSGAIAHEIRALHAAGYSVGLLQKRAQVLLKDRPYNPQIRACLDSGKAKLVPASHTGRVTAKLAVLHNPYVFAHPEDGMPTVVARQKVLVAHEPLIDANGVPNYDPVRVHRLAEKLVGEGVVWAPLSPLSRRNLEAANLPYRVLPDDWTNVLFVEDWAADRSRPVGSRPVIGRHSRPEWQKWPATREELLSLYPEGDEFEVRLLGVGGALTEIIGEPMPSNWTTFEFNDMDPAAFLRTIDFFPYYHHPDWVEGFGRTIAEAAASGAVVILPEHFRVTFGGAALYRHPSEVLDTVRDLYADWDRYRRQSRLGQQSIQRLCGPEGYIARIEGLIGRPERSAGEGAAVALDPAGHPARRFDVVHLGDFRTTRDCVWRVANEVSIEAESGYATGLLHVSTEGGDRLPVIHPVIDGLVRGGIAVPVDPGTPLVTTGLLIIHEPDAILGNILGGSGLKLPRLLADKVIVIAEKSIPRGKLAQKNALLGSLFGDQIAWAATSAHLLDELLETKTVKVDEDVWQLSLPASSWKRREHFPRPVPAIGRLVAKGKDQWPQKPEELRAAYPAGKSSAVVRLLGLPRAEDLGLNAVPESWEMFDTLDIDPWRFLRGLDFFVYFPSRLLDDIPANAMAWSMAQGIPVIAPKFLEPRLGRGPIYAAAESVASTVGSLHGDATRMETLRAEASRHARTAFGPSNHKARLRRLIGSPSRAAGAAPSRPEPRAERVLFMSSNGVGLGHLTRLLAIARRMPRNIQPVFATLSQSLSVVEQAGYPVEYLPFHVYANCDPDDWNGWFAHHFAAILDFYGPKAVVFDGGMPYGGLLKAVASRRDIGLVWVRRGMWLETQDNKQAIARQRHFDLIIEPSDIAEAIDRGATVGNRAAVLKVPPISLLDSEELLDRADAAARLGLDPERPAVLIQLGSGWNRDLASMVDIILGALAERPAVQPVLAEWLMSGTPLTFWPGVRRLRGFPITKYYSAFDFTISAAGYNSFNEILSFGLPAIFIANEHSMLDDQNGRAAYAEEHGAALRLPATQLPAIGPLMDALLDERLRWLAKANSGRLAQGNGAAEAAEAIARLVM